MASTSATDKVAAYWVPDGDAVRCGLCPHRCRIAEGKAGICGVRENRGGTLFAATYGKVASVAVDPVEKKPLFHFHPGARILSIGSAGCNFRCEFCQNWQLVLRQVPLEAVADRRPAPDGAPRRIGRDRLHLQRAVHPVRVRPRMRQGVPGGGDEERPGHQRVRLSGAAGRAPPLRGRDEHRPEVDGPRLLPEDLRRGPRPGPCDDPGGREGDPRRAHHAPLHGAQRCGGAGAESDRLRRGDGPGDPAPSSRATFRSTAPPPLRRRRTGSPRRTASPGNGSRTSTSGTCASRGPRIRLARSAVRPSSAGRGTASTRADCPGTGAPPAAHASDSWYKPTDGTFAPARPAWDPRRFGSGKGSPRPPPRPLPALLPAVLRRDG